MRRRFLFLPPVVRLYLFCSLRHASNGFFRELATMSFICCSTTFRFCSATIDEFCRDFRRLFSSPLQHHLGLLDHSSEECLRLLRPLLNISPLPENSFGRPRPFTSMRLGVSFRTRTVARLLICPYCFCKSRLCSNLSSEIEQFLSKLRHNRFLTGLMDVFLTVYRFGFFVCFCK